ncbi:hypothetical protein P389DRAFT_87518 [Cystobasidium minutum MCA 4210]|uniref:uncharacterized protein n=1 Tax=Cystobasidium minutum MCA 4210 TaxID=1397322 RepID=UPI0034CF482F|eukprot:jgi/Rhomi1/87518/CE87517_1014
MESPGSCGLSDSMPQTRDKHRAKRAVLVCTMTAIHCLLAFQLLLPGDPPPFFASQRAISKTSHSRLRGCLLTNPFHQQVFPQPAQRGGLNPHSTQRHLTQLVFTHYSW